MNANMLATVAATGFTVAFLHAAIPTHWLPFVLVARARGWSAGRTMGIVALAGLGHVLLTSLLGLAIARLGSALVDTVGRVFPWVVGGCLLAIGSWYFWRQWRGGGICHHAVPGGHHHADEHCGHEEPEHSHWDTELKDSALVAPGTGDWSAVSGLFLMLTLSPCEGFLPIYLSGVQFGWTGFAVLSGILAAGTLLGMLLFTWLTLHGLQRFKLRSFERNEAGLLGVMFVLLGLIVLILER
jgi:nickel/cobalt exporter